jgi:hypothetical protein
VILRLGGLEIGRQKKHPGNIHLLTHVRVSGVRLCVVHQDEEYFENFKDEKAGYCYSMFRQVFEKILIITDKGFCGLGPPETRNGDLVCVLFGCYLIVVIRPSSLHEGEYVFVGPAYLCGAMEGEVVKDSYMEERKLKVERFTLC